MPEGLANPDKYRPTPKEQDLLEIMINPENYECTPSKLMELASVNPNCYYDAIKKKGFIELLKEKSFNLVDSSIPLVVNAFVSHAKKGSYQHGKTLLEMGNMIEDPSEKIIKAANNYIDFLNHVANKEEKE